MKLLWHQALKDVRANRWWLGVWVTALAANTALYAIDGPWVTLVSDSAFAGRVSFLGWHLPAALQSVLGWLIAIRMVIADPLDDTNAFWLTRPVSRGTMFAAKFCLTSALFLGLPAVSSIVAAAANGTEWQLLPRLAIERMALAAVLLWPLLLIAAITKDLARLVIVSIVAVIVFFGLPNAPQPMMQSAVAGWTTGLAAVVALLAHQYLTRRRLRTLALAALSAGTVALIVWLWPERLVVSTPPSASPAALGMPAARASVGEIQSKAVIVGRRVPNTPVARIAGRLAFDGLPANWMLRLLEGRGTWQADGEPTLRTAWSTDRWKTAYDWVSADPEWGWERALSATIHARVDEHPLRLIRDRLVEIPQDEFGRVAGRTGRLEADYQLAAFELREEATMPFRSGASMTVGSSRITLVSVEPIRNGFRWLTIRVAQPRFVMPWRPPENHLLLRNRRLKQASTFFFWPGLSLGAPGLGLTGSALDVRTFRFREKVGTNPFAAKGTAQGLSSEFIDGAEVVLVRAHERGRITLHVSDDAFRLPEWPTR